ncbi:meiotic recombination 11-like protein A [Ochromonadaceae sp. CCMP2298]|nr:meiotic recombination 11-like protein A [Ochromonadaceae sp. CCMP2298]
MDDDIVRIMVSTDNHLGFMERDPVRCDDAMASFEEVLRTAREKQVDFVLLAGDTFHENKPTFRPMHAVQRLLMRYCRGAQPVYTAVLNEQTELFRANNGRVNFEDPNIAVSMPIYAIHGNHDDPSRVGCLGESLCAMDLLAVNNLLNYFGKADRVEDIEVSPILIQKGRTKGAIRDERLNRMWNQKLVSL